MSWFSFDKPAHSTFDEGALKNGALKDAVINIVKGESPPKAILNAILPTGDKSMNYVLDRLKEPSSHAGLALLFQAVKAFFPQYSTIFDVLSAIFAGSAVVTPGK